MSLESRISQVRAAFDTGSETALVKAGPNGQRLTEATIYRIARMIEDAVDGNDTVTS